MIDIPDEHLAPFLSPLTHDQHAQIGRLAVVWGQIDMVLDQLLQHTMGLTGKQRQTLVGEKPIGAKLDMLAQHIDDIEDETTRYFTRRFWDLANQTKSHRNRCFHGVWGWWAAPRKKMIPAAAHFKSLENPVKSTDLTALEKKLCRTSRVGFEALRRLADFGDFKGCSRLTHGSGLFIPPWIQEWIEQHPLDDQLLGRKHKAGRLPYLEKPL
jgi:hypothetical protein